jgi:serine/threonine protein kinase
MEDYLGDPAAPEHAILLCELAVLDIGYRRLAGENPSVAEYQARFPDLDAVRLTAMLASRSAGGPASTIDTYRSRQCQTEQQLRYRILRPHARGGLGEVFVALDQELHREVALKEIKEDRAHDAVSRGRFLLEAEITGGLEHPGIVPVYGLGQYADGRPFYAMRFIKGDNLKEAIRCFHAAEQPGRDPGERSLALRQLLRRFVDVCNAVAYAHHRGVLHRDLKPGNIMLGKYGETLIVDWGLAKPIGRSDLTRTPEESTLQPSSGSDWVETVMGTAVGTPAYMSPEQAAGRLDLLGPASDIYSLGATLYALLTGKAPFAGSDPGEVLQRVQRGEWRPPRQVKAGTPPALDAICRKAMALKPEDRYSTVLALAGDLEHWLADEPVTAYREPWTGRLRRWARRHRRLTAGTIGLLVTTGLALVIGLVAAEEQRQRAIFNFVEMLGAQGEAKLAKVDSITYLAEFLRGKGMLAEAEIFYRQILKEEEQDATDDPGGLTASERARNGHNHMVLCRVLMDQGKLDEAELLLRERIATLRRTSYTGLETAITLDRLEACLRTAITLEGLGTCLVEKGQAEEAEKLLREALEIRQGIEEYCQIRPGGQRFRYMGVPGAQSLLGASLVEQGRYAEAEPLLLESYQVLRSHYDELAADHPAKADVSRAAKRCLKLYQAWSKPEEAVKWQELLLDNNVPVAFEDPPLDRAVQTLACRTCLDIRLDVENLKEAGIASNANVPLQMRGVVSLRSALNLLLGAYDLTFKFDEKGLVVTTRKFAQTGRPAASDTQRARAQRIEGVLDGNSTFDLEPQSLTDAAQYFEKVTKEHFILDPAARRAGLLDPMMKVNGTATDMPLRHGIKKLLDPLGLTIVVRDEVVVITPK